MADSGWDRRTRHNEVVRRHDKVVTVVDVHAPFDVVCDGCDAVVDHAFKRLADAVLRHRVERNTGGQGTHHGAYVFSLRESFTLAECRRHYGFRCSNKYRMAMLSARLASRTIRFKVSILNNTVKENVPAFDRDVHHTAEGT